MFESYHVVVIFLVLAAGYIGSLFLVKVGKISLVWQRKWWNIFLAVSFIISGTFGIILAIMLDYKIRIPWYRDLLWYHVEFGIAMAIVAVFHLLWHLKYYFPKK